MMIQMREREDDTDLSSAGSPLTCEEFQGQMAELIGSGIGIGNHEHLKSCKRCAELLQELEDIADAARHLLPVYEPSTGLWDKLRLQIEDEGTGSEKGTPVVENSSREQP